MAGWYHRLDGHEFERTPGVGDGQGGLACCSSRVRKESDMTERRYLTSFHFTLDFGDSATSVHVRRVGGALKLPPSAPHGRCLPCGDEISVLFVLCRLGALFFLSILYSRGRMGMEVLLRSLSF